MRIGSSITMTGEVFAKGKDTVLLQSAPKSGSEGSYLVWIRAKGACTNDRVRGIVIDIKIWSEVNVNAHGAHFGSHGGCHAISVFGVRSGADGHGRGKFGETFILCQAGNAATLLIDGDEQSRISTFDSGLLELVRERSNLSRRLDIARK